MATLFSVISYDGYDFDAAGYTIKVPWSFWRGQLGSTIPTGNRPGLLPTLGKGSINPRRMTFDVVMPSTVGFALAYETFLSKLKLMDPVPRTLILQRPGDDGVTPVNVQCQAVVETPQGPPNDESADTVTVTFIRADPVWRVVTPPSAVTIASYDSTSWSGGTAYTAAGSAPISPIVTIDTGAPGSGSAPNRYSFTVTNNRSYPIVKMPWLVNLGNTTGWTGSTAANTFLFCDGIEVPREVIAMGQTRTYLLFTIDRLAQGQTKTYEILTGGTNPAIATTAQALSGRIKAPVPDFGWQVITTTAAGTGTTTVTASALATGTDYASAPTDRWKGGYIVGLTGAAAGTDHQITANTSTTITTDSAFAAYASGSTFLIMASWLYAAGNILFLNYAVRLTEHSDYPHGLWYEDTSQTKPGDIRYDSPFSWEPARTWDNNDDVAFKSVSPAVGDYFTTPNISRTWQGGDDNSNLKERGTADSVVISYQVPVNSWTLDYQFKNPNGIGRAVIASRQSQAEDWTLHAENATAYSTLTDISVATYTPVSETLHLMFGVWPSLGDEIPTSWRRDSGGRSGGGYTTLTDDSKDWPTDIWVGARMRITSGKGQGISRTITTNDANTLTWSTAIPTDDLVPNDGSRYEVVNPALIANVRSNDVWKVLLDVSSLTTSAITSMGAAERVSVRVRANGGASATTNNVYLNIGCDSRYLWVASGNTVVVNCETQTALVMNGSTVVRDVTDWVRAYQFLTDTPVTGSTFTGKTPDWFPIQPGSGTFYTQRVLGSATHATSIVLTTGYLG